MTTKQTVQAPILRYPFHFHRRRGEQPRTNDDTDHHALPSRVPVQGLDANDLEVLTQKLSSLEADLEQSISTLEKSKSKIRKTFDDSSTCCSTTCMDDSLSSLKASSHNQLLGMTLEPPCQNHQDRQQRDQQKVEGDAVEEDRDINNGDANLDGDESPHHKDDKSLNENHSGSLEESSSSLASLSLYSLRRSASFVAMNTISNKGKDRFHHSFDTSALSVGTYRRRRERRYRKIRNSLQATSMDIRSLPRELELEEQETSHSDLQQET